MLHKESLEFTWDSMEFEYKEKTKNWYIYVGIVTLLLIVLSIIIKDYLFGVLILIGGFLMFSLSTKKPEILPVEISQHGIKIHGDMYPYTDIYSFWIGQNKRNEAILLISTNRKISSTISVNIAPQINIMQIREFLLQFIKEKEIHESFTNRFIEKIGF